MLTLLGGVKMDENITKPIYQQIAIDIAGRIASGEFQVGRKIHGRSTLAGQYKVSPETIRRSVKLLEDMKIVEVTPGSGITVKSKDEAFKFINKFQNISSMTSLKKDIWKLLEEKNKLDRELKSCIDKFIDYSERFKHSNPFAPIEVEIPHNSHIIGKTIGESNFWHNTGVTIIAIKKDNNIILSPGPYADFQAEDILVMVGDENALERVTKYLNDSY